MLINNYTYFQFNKENQIPIYIRADLSQFDEALTIFLTEQKFTKLSPPETIEVEKIIKENKNARLLSISLAGPSISRQIGSFASNDQFGPESISPRDSWRFYRYKGVGILMYSALVSEWSLATYKNFGSVDNRPVYRTMLARFLSWGLAPLGIAGFWGSPVQEGVVIQRPSSCFAEAVFIDIFNSRMFTLDGVKNIAGAFKIIRLDAALKGRDLKMSSEELISFLTLHSTFFEYSGPSVPVRQIIQALGKIADGHILPRENYKPRTDLSL